MSIKHRHRAATLFAENVVAVTPKHNDARCCVGDVKKCQCGTLVFFPHTLGLFPVEVELIEERAKAKPAKAA